MRRYAALAALVVVLLMASAPAALAQDSEPQNTSGTGPPAAMSTRFVGAGVGALIGALIAAGVVAPGLRSRRRH